MIGCLHVGILGVHVRGLSLSPGGERVPLPMPLAILARRADVRESQIEDDRLHLPRVLRFSLPPRVFRSVGRPVRPTALFFARRSFRFKLERSAS